MKTTNLITIIGTAIIVATFLTITICFGYAVVNGNCLIAHFNF